MKNILIARFVGTIMSIPTPSAGTFKVLAVGTQAAMQAQADRLNAAITSPNNDVATSTLVLGTNPNESDSIEFAVVECVDSVAVDDTVQVAQGLVQKVVAPQITQPMLATTKASGTDAAPAPKRRLGKSAK